MDIRVCVYMQSILQGTDKIQKHVGQCYYFFLKPHMNIYLHLKIDGLLCICFMLLFLWSFKLSEEVKPICFPELWNSPWSSFLQCANAENSSFIHPQNPFLWLLTSFSHISQRPQEWHSSSSSLPHCSQSHSFCYSLLWIDDSATRNP